MTAAPALQPLGPQALRFAAVGGLATATHAGGALAAAAMLGLAPSLANLAGYAAAVSVSYWGHARVTFRTRGGHRRQVPRFAAVSLGGLALSAALTALVCDLGGGPLWLAMVLVALVVPAASFAAGRRWAFAARPAPQPPRRTR